MKNQEPDRPQKNQHNKLHKLKIKACKGVQKSYIRCVHREDYLKLIGEIEGEVLAAKRLADLTDDESDRPDELSRCRRVLELCERNLLAARWLLERHDKLERKAPSAVRTALPQSVGERVIDFLSRHAEPFTVEQARADIKSRFSEDVTMSAVAQALRRMVLVGNQVKQVKEGKGPLPAYFQRISITDRDVILAVLNDHQTGLGKTEREICEATQLIPPVVHKILRDNPDSFVVGPDNLWRKKRGQAS